MDWNLETAGVGGDAHFALPELRRQGLAFALIAVEDGEDIEVGLYDGLLGSLATRA